MTSGVMPLDGGAFGRGDLKLEVEPALALGHDRHQPRERSEAVGMRPDDGTLTVNFDPSLPCTPRPPRSRPRVASLATAAERRLAAIWSEGLGVAEVEVVAECANGFEAVKTVSELYAPIAGEVTAVNGDLAGEPGLVNASPYEKGWMIRIRMIKPAEMEKLLEKQRKALEERKKQQEAGGGTPAPAPTP